MISTGAKLAAVGKSDGLYDVLAWLMCRTLHRYAAQLDGVLVDYEFERATCTMRRRGSGCADHAIGGEDERRECGTV